eukprot:13767010-Heterocapsa_arctica.AAC.1
MLCLSVSALAIEGVRSGQLVATGAFVLDNSMPSRASSLDNSFCAVSARVVCVAIRGVSSSD